MTKPNEKTKTMKYMLAAAILAGLLPYTAGAQVDPGEKKTEVTAAPTPATVIVGNTPAAPVYIADADAAHRRPYVLSAIDMPFAAAGQATLSKSFINNTSQLFVITNFSSWAIMNTSDVFMNCILVISGTGVTGGVPALGPQYMLFPELYSGVNMFPGTVTYSANTGMLMYLMPGQTALLSCQRGPAPGQTLGNGQLDNVYVTLTGHLEDLPPVPNQ